MRCAMSGIGSIFSGVGDARFIYAGNIESIGCEVDFNLQSTYNGHLISKKLDQKILDDPEKYLRSQEEGLRASF